MNGNIIMNLVTSCEIDNGSILETDMFDRRLIQTRKIFNNGIDPFDEQFHDFDFRSAQLMLDQGIKKELIANELGLTKNKLQQLIVMGGLSDKKWHDITFTPSGAVKGTRYRLYRNGDYITEGTVKQIHSNTDIAIGKIRYWKSRRYKSRRHKVNYKLVEIEES